MKTLRSLLLTLLCLITSGLNTGATTLKPQLHGLVQGGVGTAFGHDFSAGYGAGVTGSYGALFGQLLNAPNAPNINDYDSLEAYQKDLAAYEHQNEMIQREFAGLFGELGAQLGGGDQALGQSVWEWNDLQVYKTKKKLVDGELVKLRDKDGNFIIDENAYLFTLDDGKEVIVKMTAQDVRSDGKVIKKSEMHIYDTDGKEYQWTSPGSKDYLPLKDVNPELAKLIQGFTMEDITEFSNRNFYSWQFKGGGAGDWKNGKEFIISVDGKPYWHDGVGQIPFAVDTYREGGMTKDQAIRATVETGRARGDGKIWKPTRETGDIYDVDMIMRGALYAAERYEFHQETVWGGNSAHTATRMTTNENASLQILHTPVTEEQKEKYDPQYGNYK